MIKTYRIAERNLERFYHEINILNRRAVKLSVPVIVLRKTGQIDEVPVKNDFGVVTHVNRWVYVEVSGETPKFAGWSIAAVIEHTEEGNLLRKSPNCTAELAQFRTGAPRCDHCHTIRNRRDTFVLVHEDKRQVQVGSNCIKDFLGHANPHQLAAWAELMFSVGELGGECEDGFEGMGGGRGDSRVYVATLLSFAACATRHLGFISGKRAHEDLSGRTVSTGSTTQQWMNPPRDFKLGRDYFLPEEIDNQRAKEAKDYVLDTLGAKPAESLNDFEHNLLLACKCTSVEPRNAGLLAFIPEYYARSIEEAKSKAEEKHFGEVGKRARKVELTYVKSSGFDTQYGTMFVHSFFAGPGEKIIWKTSNGLDLNPSGKMIATFTVKEHGEFKGHKQTKISRLVEETPITQPA